MSFHELSTELLLMIGELCKPHDAYSLALCCHTSYNALSKLLWKHHKVWRYWNTVDTKDAKRPFHTRLLKLARKPHLALYIETFKCEFEYNDTGAYTEFEVAELIVHLESFATTHGHIFDEFKDDLWRQHYQLNLANFWMRALSTYLVYMAPDLRRLEYIGDIVGEDDLLRLLIDVARASARTTGLPLQHLRVIEVKLDRSIDEGGLYADWLLASMCLPCVETFAASRMSGVLRWMTLNDVPNSNIKTIVLQASTMDSDSLIPILSKMTNLKSFACEIGQGELVTEGSFSPKKITTALIQYAGRSLEHLTIHGENSDVQVAIELGNEIPHVSLADFKQLKTLRCSTYLLTSDPQFPLPSEPLALAMDITNGASEEYREAARNYKSDHFLNQTLATLRRLAFVSRLPQSLKALHLEGYPCHTPLAYNALLEFVQKANGLLPCLKQLYLSDWSIEYLENKGLLDVVAHEGLRYKKLPNPFRIGFTVRTNPDSESEFEDSLKEED